MAFVDLLGGWIYKTNGCSLSDLLSTKKVIEYLGMRFCAQAAPEQFSFMTPMVANMITKSFTRVSGIYCQKLATRPNQQGDDIVDEVSPSTEKCRCGVEFLKSI